MKKKDLRDGQKARILVIDDHSVVRHGLAALLAAEKDLAICGEAATYEEGLAAALELQPDLMLVDIVLKDRSGLDLIRDAREKGYEGYSLVLSMHDEMTHAEKALRAGAQGYVLKENADEVIVGAIREVLAGELYFSERASEQILRQMIENPPGETPEYGIESLTGREKEVFTCIGEGLSTKKIAEKLGLSARTVEVHRAHIKHKLQCEDAAQVFREAVRWVEQQTGT